MVEKVLLEPTLLAGQLAVKVLVKELIVDTEDNENLVCDLIKLDDEDNEVVYYENAVYGVINPYFELTEEELAEL